MAARLSLKAGDLISGKYRVERVLGVGGMGLVVAATNLSLGQPVAIKVMLPEIAGMHGAVDRFLREARAAGKLRSEHVVAIKDVSTLSSPEGTPFIVMELLQGSDLGKLIDERKKRREGPLPARDAVDYVGQACLALAEAHAQGIVHRDIKPSNMFLTTRPDGAPLIKLLDFGISKMEDGLEGLTQTRAVLGSSHYMSPEQLRSAKNADARSDIWSMGVTLFELVSGKLPFPGEAFADVCAAIARDAAPRVTIPGLDNVIDRCLSKEPRLRYQTVAELAEALAPHGSEGSHQLALGIRRTLAGSRQVALPLLPAAAGESTAGAGSTLDHASAQSVTHRRWGRRFSLPMAVGGAVVIGLAVGTVVILGMRPRTASVAVMDEGRPVDVDTVMNVVRSEVVACAERAGVAGKLEVRISIDAEGTVTGVSAETAAGECVEAAVRSARFPTAGRPTTITLPFWIAAVAPAPADAGTQKQTIKRGPVAPRPRPTPSKKRDPLDVFR